MNCQPWRNSRFRNVNRICLFIPQQIVRTPKKREMPHFKEHDPVSMLTCYYLTPKKNQTKNNGATSKEDFHAVWPRGNHTRPVVRCSRNDHQHRSCKKANWEYNSANEPGMQRYGFWRGAPALSILRQCASWNLLNPTLWIGPVNPIWVRSRRTTVNIFLSGQIRNKRWTWE